MKTLILAGGQGTRIREETQTKPKPMVDVGDKPLLWHIMKTYAHHGQNDFVICMGYLGHVIRDYFLDYDRATKDVTVNFGEENKVEFHRSQEEVDFSVTLADTGPSTMTGGRIKRVSRYIQDDETFMVTYGDGLSDVDISKLLAFHKSHGKIGTVTAVQPESRFGILDLDGDDKVKKFIEKPKLDGWINAGYFVFERAFLDYLTGDDCVLEQSPLERLAADGELLCYKHPGFFYAMDTFREYQELNDMWNKGTAPWKVW
ncbi:MAG: glucose-1-phosphate cytidylyltransferase [Hyphomicrobiales bacterium]